MSEQRVVLLLQQVGDGPLCRVRDAFRIEVITEEEGSAFDIEHEDGVRIGVKGPGYHDVNIPAGRVRVRRVKGTLPATVYAWS